MNPPWQPFLKRINILFAAGLLSGCLASPKDMATIAKGMIQSSNQGTQSTSQVTATDIEESATETCPKSLKLKPKPYQICYDTAALDELRLKSPTPRFEHPICVVSYEPLPEFKVKVQATFCFSDLEQKRLKFPLNSDTSPLTRGFIVVAANDLESLESCIQTGIDCPDISWDRERFSSGK